MFSLLCLYGHDLTLRVMLAGVLVALACGVGAVFNPFVSFCSFQSRNVGNERRGGAFYVCTEKNKICTHVGFWSPKF